VINFKQPRLILSQDTFVIRFVQTCIALLLVASASSARAQTPAQTQIGDTDSTSIDAPAGATAPDGNSASTAASTCDLLSAKWRCVADLMHDQAGIWTSPLRAHPRDAYFLLPLAGAITISTHYDQTVLSKLPPSPNRTRISNDVSLLGSSYVLVAVAGTTYATGKLIHNEHVRETGVLGLLALADAGIVDHGLKLLTNRSRPNNGLGRGQWWPDDTDVYTINGSFPSGHATATWALAHLIAEETPHHLWLHVGLYTLAAAVSTSRVTGRNHFPSDVIAGSFIGYMVGGYVYRQHSQFYKGGVNALGLHPIYDSATHTYGAGLSLNPESMGPAAAALREHLTHSRNESGDR
jgi:membrane-associated phospholipid phosphatase